MSLPAVPLSPGKARGPVVLAAGPETWPLGSTRGVVLAIPERWWPSLTSTGPAVRACVTDGTDLAPHPTLGIPAVGGVDFDLLRDGETVEVDGTRGVFSIEGVDERAVVTALLQRSDGKILLLRRSSRVGSFRGRWAGVSGYLEVPEPIEQARREVREETGIPPTELTLVRTGKELLARDGSRVYVVHPFLFRIGRPDVRLDWEHTDAEWVDPDEIARRDTVPKLDRVWRELSRSPDRRKG